MRRRLASAGAVASIIVLAACGQTPAASTSSPAAAVSSGSAVSSSGAAAGATASSLDVAPSQESETMSSPSSPTAPVTSIDPAQAETPAAIAAEGFASATPTPASVTPVSSQAIVTFKQIDDTVSVAVNGTEVFTNGILRYNQPNVTVDVTDKLVSGTNAISVSAQNGMGSGTIEGNLTVDGKVVREWKVIGDSRVHHADFFTDSFSFDYSAPSAPSTSAAVDDCQLPVGWTKCRKIADPTITIYGNAATTDAAMDAVQKIYTDLTGRFTDKYPRSKMNGYTIYLTNGQPWSELSSLAPIGTMWTGTVENGMAQGDELRGGASQDWLWIDEQMICKTGIVTRNEAYAAGLRSEPDNNYRSFDQVVHEFGHGIMYRFGLQDRINQVYAGSNSPVEDFPWSIQRRFGVPAGTEDGDAAVLMDEIFSSSTTYSCDALYQP